MAMQIFTKRTRINSPASTVFAWHARPGAFERLTPPWERVQILEKGEGIGDGARRTFRVRIGPIRVRWVAEHRDHVAGRQFRDVQVEGPFRRWEHTHRFHADGPEACYLEDQVEYELPLGALGNLFGSSFARSMLARMFAYRHSVTVGDLAAHGRYSDKALHVALTGSGGLVGSALAPFLTTGGHRVTRLVRSPPRPGDDALRWDPEANAIDAAGLEGLDGVIHLAGESIAGGRWTAAKRARILDSRVKGTRLLAETLAKLRRPPRTLVCASAIGFYGSRGAELMTEESAPGTGFLAGVCQAWEEAATAAAKAGIRVVYLRLGVVLSAAGGALATMLPPFRLGAGGVLGPGSQYVSWVGLDDVLGAVLHSLTSETVRGPVNVVAPNPVTNRNFTGVLGRVLHRPTLIPVPAAAARLALGEMADEMLLASTRVDPVRLRDTGFVFRQPDLEGALRHTLGRIVES